MSFFRLHRRVTAALFAMTLVAVATKGLCLMPVASVDTAPDAHSCCTKGRDILVAGCCMDGSAEADAATTTGRTYVPVQIAATVSQFALTPVVGTERRALGAPPHHSPPFRIILRV